MVSKGWQKRLNSYIRDPQETDPKPKVPLPLKGEREVRELRS